MTEPDGARCRGCKRRMKHHTKSGYGPVCERRINGRRPRTVTPAAEAGPGQDELPYDDQLELPWSTTWPASLSTSTSSKPAPTLLLRVRGI